MEKVDDLFVSIDCIRNLYAGLRVNIHKGISVQSYRRNAIGIFVRILQKFILYLVQCAQKFRW